MRHLSPWVQFLTKWKKRTQGIDKHRKTTIKMGGGNRNEFQPSFKNKKGFNHSLLLKNTVSFSALTKIERVTSTRWHFAFSAICVQCIRLQAYVLVCCHSNKTCAPVANPPNTVQLEGTPYHSPKLHPGPCSSVGMRPGTDRQIDTQMAMANIHFASAMPHAKCNQHCSAAQTGRQLHEILNTKDWAWIPTDLFFINRNSRFRSASSPWRPSPPAIIKPPGENDITDDEFRWTILTNTHNMYISTQSTHAHRGP